MKKPKAATVGEKMTDARRAARRIAAKFRWDGPLAETLERQVEASLKQAACEAAWDGFNFGHHSNSGNDDDAAVAWGQMEAKYGKRPARRKA